MILPKASPLFPLLSERDGTFILFQTFYSFNLAVVQTQAAMISNFGCYFLEFDSLLSIIH